MRLSESGRTPDLSEVIQLLIEAALTNVNVCLPGKIVAYDAQTQYADVQPVLQSRRENGMLFTRAVIPNVPVKHPRASGGTAFAHMPLKVGDDVTLIFSQRSLDNWKTKGGITDPADRRKFNVSDAYALVGGSALPDAFSVNDPDAIEVVNGSGKYQVKSDGTINLGDFSPTHKVALDDKVKTRLEDIEGKLNSLISDYNNHIHPYVDTPIGPSVTSPTLLVETPLVPSPDAIGSSKVKVVT